jgi:hypothetical protein
VSISYTVTDPGTDNFVLDHGVSWGDATTNTSLRLYPKTARLSKMWAQAS